MKRCAICWKTAKTKKAGDDCVINWASLCKTCENKIESGNFGCYLTDYLRGFIK